ncbi:MAG: helicase C-terminal domain-containing protein [Chitinispirillaceae bacterium]
MPQLSELLSGNTDKNKLDKLRSLAKKKNPNRAPKKHIGRSSGPGHHKTTVPDFVAIDLETTGLDYRADRIIEIGMVKFKEGKLLDEYSTFVNPQIPIPQMISELTGIEDGHVKEAPFIEDVIDDVIGFIGEEIMCGHQVEFDYNFINECLRRLGRKPLKNQQLDSAAMSRILLPGLIGYSLGQVSQSLNVTLDNAHRALDDARASGHVVIHLVPKINDIHPYTRQILANFAPGSMLKTMLYRSVRGVRDQLKAPMITVPKPIPKLNLPDQPESVETRRVEEIFSKQGPLSKLLDTYTVRASQKEMALAVMDALNAESNVVAEAGTGTGKSLAYLVPAALWAQHNNCRVLVSTHTRNLQDQLMSNDLPMVSKLVGGDFRFSVLKGRSNYLCRFRWQKLLNREIGNLSRRERFGVLPLIRWAEETKTGDIEEQNQFNRKWFPKVWNLVSAESHDCMGWRCPINKSCFLQQARQKALNSHVVVINHGLFFSDICAETSFLGQSATVIFDEAHHLESCGHHYLRVEIDTNRLNRYVETLSNLLKQLEKQVNTQKQTDAFRSFKSVIKKLRKYSGELLADLNEWVNKKHSDSADRFEIRYKDDPFQAISAVAGLTLAIDDTADTLQALAREYVVESDEEKDDISADISSCMDKTAQLKADLRYLLAASTEDHVFWIEGQKGKWIKLCGVPLDIGGLLKDIWSKKRGATIFTSATLSVSGSFDFFSTRIGLAGDQESKTAFSTYRSPFVEQQTVRCAVDGTMDPADPDYDSYITEAIKRLAQRFGKNILVLFTANSLLDSVWNGLKSDPLFCREHPVLSQGAGKSRRVLLEHFRQSHGAILLGTDSFWEGVDVPGEACELVVIPKLPFPVPTHPLTSSLCDRAKKQSGESFFSYCVPEAVIKFRQGAGRLIRSAEDYGALVVLDRRMVKKGYGKAFTRSLDGEFLYCNDIDEAVHEIDSFFRRI